MKHLPHIVFIGPSGSGKSTLASLLLQNHPQIKLAKTYTTRPHRVVDDDNHIFVDTNEFQALKDQGTFIGTLDVFGASYGLPKLPDQQCLLLLRAPVVLEFKKSYPESIVIEIDAPIELLQQRLKDRQSHDRLDSEFLEKEIQVGRQLTDLIVDTARPIDECLQTVETYINS